MRESQGVRGFSTGAYIDVREQGARSGDAEMRRILVRKTRRCEQDKEGADLSQGAYIDVRNQGETQT